MMLVIAEKSELGRDIAGAMCGSSGRLPASGNGYTVAACSGHLLELAAPEDIDAKWGRPWREDALPIYIEGWPKVPAPGKEGRLEAIGHLLAQCDGVVHAGDPDEEGQLIVDEVLDYFGYTGPVMRAYVNDNIPENILKAFASLRDNAGCKGDGHKAHARQLADAAFGFNETRLATLRLGRLVPVGRVQTPTLGLVVARDAAVEGHVAQAYFDLTATLPAMAGAVFSYFPDKGAWPPESLVAVSRRTYSTDRDALCAVAASVDGREVEVSTEAAEEREEAPLPYNLTVLISDMSKRYKYTADKVMGLTQSLRDTHKAITYNRTDSQYLKEEHLAQAPVVLARAMSNCGIDWPLDFSVRPRAFDGRYVTSHHGIIPQDVGLDMSQLSEGEQNVYRAITERYAAQFLPAEAAVVSTSVFEAGKGRFSYRARRVTDRGWKAYLQGGGKDAGAGGGLIEAGTAVCTVEGTDIAEKQTSPPKPYTDGTLIADMANISRHVTDPRVRELLRRKDEGKKGEGGGIGTTATRPDVIKRLKERGYIEEAAGALRSTQLGRELFALLPDAIKGADTTAMWWVIQQDIGEGRKDVNELQRSVIKVFESHRGTSYAGMSLKEAAVRESAGACPNCGAGLHYIKGAYTCSTNKSQKQPDGTWQQVSGCGFKMWESVAQKKLTKPVIQELLGKGVTAKKVKGLKSKSGKAYEAVLALDKATGRISPVF